MANFFNFDYDQLTKDVAKILSNQRIIIQRGKDLMTLLDDFHAAIANVQASVQTAIALIQSLHAGGPDTVSDAEVQTAIDELNAANAALGAAQPQP